MNKVRSKDSKGFSGRNRKFKRFFRPKTVISKKKGLLQICKGFSGRNRKFKRFFWPKAGDLQKKYKKKSSSQKRHEIRCQSTKNTNLGLDLHSTSPEPVNFFGALSSLVGATIFVWGHKQSFGGARPR